MTLAEGFSKRFMTHSRIHTKLAKRMTFSAPRREVELKTLKRVASDVSLRRSLIQHLQQERDAHELISKIRFLAAVNQLDECNSAAERIALETKIRMVFLQPQGMCSLHAVASSPRYHHQQQLRAIQDQVLSELAQNELVAAHATNATSALNH